MSRSTPLSTGNGYETQQRKGAWFYLDEGLPALVAVALRSVGHPIEDPDSQDKRGEKDPQLIPWMGGLAPKPTWITKDDEARKVHIAEIKKYGLSVVWVRGLDGAKNKISITDLHLMLTVKLPQLIKEISASRTPRHYALYMKGTSPALHRVVEDDVRVGQPLIPAKRRRQRRG